MERKDNIREITPKDMQCIALGCPGIYEERCGIGACPVIEEYREEYLIIGKKRNPNDFGLEKKVGENEILVSVPKDLIDNMKK